MTLLEAITTILVTHSSKGAISPDILAPEIIATADRHGVNPYLLTKIVLVESRGIASAVNLSTDDHGLMQINERTRESSGISTWCVKQWQCNLHVGTKILARVLKMRNGRPCMFNVGPRGRLPKYETTCKKYEAKLAAL